MIFRNKKSFLITLVLVLFLLVSFVVVKAEEETSNINVGYTVPSGGGNTGGGTSDNYPSISDVASSVTYNSAQVTWTATDSNGITSVSFFYGKTDSYGTEGSVEGSYEVNLTELESNTTYYFKISVTDTAAQTTIHEDSFQTTEYSEPDTTPPVISDIGVVPGITTCDISWLTDEVADSQVSYGLTDVYGSSAFYEDYIEEHEVTLVDLLPNTTYHYQIISTDESSNSANTDDSSFTTLKDEEAPPNVSNLSVVPSESSIDISWSNPSLLTTPDFSGVKVLRKVGSNSADTADGVVKYTGSLESFTDEDIVLGIDYYYTVFSYDTSENFSSGVFENGIIPIPVEICDNNIDDDGDEKIDCNDSGCAEDPACEQEVVENCSNGVDDDGDNLIDCNDNDCSGEQVCIVPEDEVCNDGIDNDGDGQIDCDDSDCSQSVSCQEILVEICNNSLDDDEDGQIDCDDSDCSGSALCQQTGQSEVCNNSIDDDEDGQIDCDDSDCSGFSECSTTPPDDEDDGDGVVAGGGGSAQCNDNIDNDEDGLIDFPNDPGCEKLSDGDEYNTPDEVIENEHNIGLGDLFFTTGNGNISLVSSENKVSGLAGFGLTVGLLENKLKPDTEVVSIILKINGSEYQLVSSGSEIYSTSIVFPKIGEHEAYLEISYSTEEFDTVAFIINSMAWGDVVDTDKNRLSGVEIKIYNENNEQVNLGQYGQKSVVLTNNNGSYGWMVPNGKYRLKANKGDYYERSTAILNIKNNVLNKRLELIKVPAKLAEVIDPEANLSENIVNVVKNLSEKTNVITEITKQKVVDTIEKIDDVADDPVVEEVAEKVVAPTAVTVVAVSALPFITWADIIPLLRFLFLQPLLLLGFRKRENWGQVYNSLNKQPVDLATVRLINVESGKIVQSKVTDGKGRYGFLVKAGKYKIEVKKNNFIFPSALLKDARDDGRKVDIYHGEVVEVLKDGSLITANVPLDVVGVKEKPTRLFWGKLGRFIQKFLSWVGLVAAVATLYISPKWYIILLVIVHIVLGLLFHRLSKKQKRKRGWGIVYDQSNKKPVGKVVARLFNAKFNKLVDSQITDRKGRYYFLASDDNYLVTFEHNKYQTHNTGNIDLTGTEEDVITKEVGLKKKE